MERLILLGENPPVSYQSQSDIDWRYYSTTKTVVEILSYARCLYIPPIIVTNFMVLVTYKYVPELRTPANRVIAALSLSDLLLGVVGIPADLSYDIYPHSVAGCVAHYPATIGIEELSLSFLMLLIIDRSLAIDHAVWYHTKATNRHANIAIITLSLLTFIRCVTMMVGMMVEGVCLGDLGVNDTTSSTAWKAVIYLFGALFGVRLLVALMCTLRILCLVVKAQRFVDGAAMTLSTRRRKQEWTMITVSLSVLFLVLWTPTVILRVAETNFGLSTPTYLLLKMVAYHCRYANSFANAIVYALSKKIYLDSFIFILKNKPCKWHELEQVYGLKSQYTYTQTGTTGTSRRTTRTKGADYKQIKFEDEKETEMISLAESELPTRKNSDEVSDKSSSDDQADPKRNDADDAKSNESKKKSNTGKKNSIGNKKMSIGSNKKSIESDKKSVDSSGSKKSNRSNVPLFM